MAHPTQGSVHSVEQMLFYTLAQIAIIILAARLAGNAATVVGQPRAVGEIVAGLLLGPSVAGALAPEAFHVVFQSTDDMPISILSQLGLILLMFQVGLEFDFSHLRAGENRTAVGLVSALGILAPFGLGLGVGHVSAPHLAPGIPALPYALFIATAFSITAVPILGRIMMDLDLTRTRAGVIAISAAAVNDAVGWTLLAFISAAATAQASLTGLATQLGSLLVYALACWYLIRYGLRFAVRQFDLGSRRLPPDLMALLLIAVFLSAMVTSRLGIFAIFGAFMIGVLLHDQRTLVEVWRNTVADLVNVLFVPLFFTYTGLRTDIAGLDTVGLWLWCATLTGLAILGKLGGCYVAARLAGVGEAEARSIAVMMNTRALMELVVLNVGYDLGVIPQRVFTMLVLMALVSTAMTAPGLRARLPALARTVPLGAGA